METSYQVRFWKVEARKNTSGKVTSYRVRWEVGGIKFREPFKVFAQADSFRAQLLAAAGRGEAFGLVSGLPVSMARQKATVTWFEFACAYVDMKWPDSAPKYRKSLAESLTRITVAMLGDRRSLPEEKKLRRALMSTFTPARRRADLPAETQQILKEVERVSKNVNDLAEPTTLRSVLRALDTNLDGKAAAANTSRIRRVALTNAIEYAIEQGALTTNPVHEVKTKKRHQAIEEVDPASVVNPLQGRMLIDAVREQGKPGPPLVAFFGVMYYAALRPEEALSLKRDDLAIPAPQRDEPGGMLTYQRGELLLRNARPEVSGEWSDDALASEERPLKHRNDSATRQVPCPPELAKLLHEHLQRFGTAPDGRLFRGARNGGRVGSNTYGRVWKDARRAVFTSEVFAGPLAKRPYDLRHAAVSTWLTSGVEPARVAKWAGHSVGVLLRVYAKCLDGGEEAARDRVDRALRGW